MTGRGIGIIDTLHLVEVARAITVLENAGALGAQVRQGTHQWFEQYLAWMTTHEYGQAERDAKNNHGTCWVAQVAEFARYTGRDDLTAFCRERFRTVLVPGQIAPDGSFPEELRRTKPSGYSLFNLDAMAMSQAQILDAGGVQGSGLATRDPGLGSLCGRSRLRTGAASARRSPSCIPLSKTNRAGRTSRTSCTTTSGRCVMGRCSSAGWRYGGLSMLTCGRR